MAGLGVFALAVAVISAPVPGFPSSLFLLASLLLFARSSERLESWVREHSLLGPWVERVEARRELSFPAKSLVVATFLAGLAISWLLFKDQGLPGFEWMLLVTGLVVATVVFWR